ncbi:MAG: pyridoxamine 5-phosphate oxidase [Tenuifilum sp.]|jgi:pyridoxamine 5'-phosphate oxidase|uniref:pyridoxamine 5'-phosphate oxidase n=1 Tax=Tenuifilum sp. TaxID=2760880 RepID=UPI0024ABDE94|nr:pyridoxamine 5'-phosphate oxidase [Tenuifilum sp.]MDI3527594.1 pyridoxamine 5-phosphate oxidase [Tenuifilum sp.]
MDIEALNNLRKEYSLKSLSKKDVADSPFKQFEIWLNESIESQVLEPNAMTLATSTFDGKPSARVVLLKQFNEKGFSFFSNYESRKSKHLLQNPYAALVFFWPELERQVRIEGKVRKATETESDEYFKTRPKGSKIGAWASPQSAVIPNRRYLERLHADFEEEFKGRQIKRPQNWGGYVLEPTLYEFWQGRPNRLHDRIQYVLVNGVWNIERLAP